MTGPVVGAVGFLVILGFWIADGRSVWPLGLVWIFMAVVSLWAARIQMRHADGRSDS